MGGSSRIKAPGAGGAINRGPGVGGAGHVGRREESRAGVVTEALPADRQPALRVMPMPADANQNGDIFGGWIMAQVDIAGGTLAGRLARGRIATVAVNSFVFKEPVHVGDLLSFYVDLVKIGNTSITVNVEVYAERKPSEPKVVKVTEATLTYVAIDSDGRPRPVPRS